MYIVRKRNLRHKVRKNIDTYQIEVELLQKIEELKHSHLVRFITAFGQQSYSRNKEYYLIFEWADGGNLRDFWSRHPSPKVTSFFIKDMINQLHGLITALRAVHCFEMHYTHGNLKPENILVFKNSIVDGIGTLKIGNWTQAEFYDEVTPLHFVTTQDGSDTCRYEAPEVETSKSSPGGRKNRHTRLNDIWSMGCITFEFIVWLLYGMSGLNKFIRDLGKNPFYQLFGEGRRKFARIHGVVVRWMDRMEEEFSCKAGETAIGDLLAIVREHLLVVSLPSDLPKRGHYGPVNGSSNTFEILAVAPGIPTKSVSLAELEQVHHEKIVRSSGAETTASIRCLAPEFSQYLEGILAREHKQRYWELRSYDDFATASTLQGEESVGENDHDTLVEEEEIPSDNYGIRLMDHDDPLEVSSVSSHITTARKRDGKAHLAQFLATDAELRVLCASVIEKLGEAVFANEGRKILKGFYLGMLGDAKTELQKQSVALLKSRSGRTRMSMQMAKMVIGAKMKDVEDVKDRIQADEQVRMREERLEMWAGIYAHNLRADEDPAQIDPEYAHAPETEWTLTESNSDGEAMSESDTREKILPKVTEMEEFFRNSKSFEMLLEGFRGVLLPPALRDILPANFVETSTEEDLSISNQIKSFVEDFTMLDWDWWPLRPRMRVLKPSERRLVWICVSRNLYGAFRILIFNSRAARGFGKK
jgi:serine/threonine protein kinase